MSELCPVLLAAHLAASDGVLSDWSVVLADSGGWGGRPGIYVDSTGRNVAMSPQNGGVPSWYCKEMPLEDDRVREIAKYVSAIPADVLKQGGLVLQHDLSCSDDPINDITLTIQGREYHFSYPLMKSCRGGQEVPEWLGRFVDALWVRYHEIERCKLIPFDAVPR